MCISAVERIHTSYRDSVVCRIRFGVLDKSESRPVWPRRSVWALYHGPCTLTNYLSTLVVRVLSGAVLWYCPMSTIFCIFCTLYSVYATASPDVRYSSILLYRTEPWTPQLPPSTVSYNAGHTLSTLLVDAWWIIRATPNRA